MSVSFVAYQKEMSIHYERTSIGPFNITLPSPANCIYVVGHLSYSAAGRAFSATVNSAPMDTVGNCSYDASYCGIYVRRLIGSWSAGDVSISCSLTGGGSIISATVVALLGVNETTSEGTFYSNGVYTASSPVIPTVTVVDSAADDYVLGFFTHRAYDGCSDIALSAGTVISTDATYGDGHVFGGTPEHEEGFGVASRVATGASTVFTWTNTIFGEARAEACGFVVKAAAAEGQILRPLAIVAAGGWSGAITDINEESANDATYIESPASPGSPATFRCTLDPGQVPEARDAHTVKYRYCKDQAAGDQIDLTVRLIEDVDSTWTTRASHQHTNIGNSWTPGSFVLTTEEAEAIVDYGNLGLEFEAVKP